MLYYYLDLGQQRSNGSYKIFARRLPNLPYGQSLTTSLFTTLVCIGFEDERMSWRPAPLQIAYLSKLFMNSPHSFCNSPSCSGDTLTRSINGGVGFIPIIEKSE